MEENESEKRKVGRPRKEIGGELDVPEKFEELEPELEEQASAFGAAENALGYTSKAKTPEMAYKQLASEYAELYKDNAVLLQRLKVKDLELQAKEAFIKRLFDEIALLKTQLPLERIRD